MEFRPNQVGSESYEKRRGLCIEKGVMRMC